MDGSSFSHGFGDFLVTAAVAIAVAGAAVGIGLWVAVPWVIHHISIVIS